MATSGLSSQEVQEKFQKFGPNLLPENSLPSSLEIFLAQIKSPLVYILLVAGIATFFLKEYSDTVIILFAVVINTILGYVQEKRAGQALSALKSLVNPLARVIRDGKEIEVDARTLVPGDVVVLYPGSKIPADGQATYVNRLFVDESVLTGESIAVSKTLGMGLFMGTFITAGQGRMVITKIGSETEMGKIAESLLVASPQTPLKKQMVKFGKDLSVMVVLLATAVFFIGIVSGYSFKEIFLSSVALAVSAIPEGLLVGLTVTLAVGMQRILANKGLVRNLVSAETLGGVTTICLDKTGTLTQGKMSVAKVIGDEDAVAMQLFLANDLDDPLVIAGYNWAVEKLQGRKDSLADEFYKMDSIPFSSAERVFASLHKFDHDQNIIFVNGAPDVLLMHAVLSQDERESHMDQVESLSGEGYRLLGLARKKVVKHKNSLEIADAFEGLEWLGVVAFIDPVREDTREALAKTKIAGIKTIMITGDYSNTAKNVLKKLDIDILEEDIMLGDNLESISNDQLKVFLARNPNPKLFARTKPAQKLKIVICLREMGEVVAMLGDGVNDAPALANADIGVVVGEASDVAKESADLVLIDSSFSTVVLAVEEGRAIYNNIRKNILYLMSDSFEEILLVVGAIALRLPMPILPAQILWVNLVSDGFPNLALTVDPKDDGVMLDPPRSPKEPLVAPWMLRIITLASVVGGLLSLAMFFYVFNTTKDEVLARSVAFAMVGMDSLIYVFSIKSLKRPTWKSNPFNNKWLLLAVAGGFVVQAAPFVFPTLGALLHVVPIGNYWWMVFAGSLLMFLLVELSKGFLKKN